MVWEEAGLDVNTNPSLEKDLYDADFIKEKVKCEVYAQKLYHSLCNTDWLRTEFISMLRQDPDRDFWSCSWRYAGGIVARLREEGDYMNWYCSGNEGIIDPEISQDLKKLGWQGIDYKGEWF